MNRPEILTASAADDIEAVGLLLAEYWTSFGFPPEFQGFASELAELPGKYTLPEGRLGLAKIESQPAGCIALRPLDEQRGEIKRLFVKPEFRGYGIGPALLDWLIKEARIAHYHQLVGDTMPFMQGALRLYERFGFQQTSAYAQNPTPGAIFLSLTL